MPLGAGLGRRKKEVEKWRLGTFYPDGGLLQITGGTGSSYSKPCLQVTVVCLLLEGQGIFRAQCDFRFRVS